MKQIDPLESLASLPIRVLILSLIVNAIQTASVPPERDLLIEKAARD
jgi:hypothetical protein